MNGLVSGREEFGASLAQHMTIKCCTAAAVAVAAANCGKKCRRRPKAAPWQSGGQGHRNYFIRATPQHSPPPSLPPALFTLPLNGAVPVPVPGACQHEFHKWQRRLAAFCQCVMFSSCCSCCYLFVVVVCVVACIAYAFLCRFGIQFNFFAQFYLFNFSFCFCSRLLLLFLLLLVLLLLLPLGFCCTFFGNWL